MRSRGAPGGRGGKRGGGATGWATQSATPRQEITLSASLGIPELREQLAAAGCLNPIDRASELVLSGRTRFYRNTPADEAIVTVVLAEAAEEVRPRPPCPVRGCDMDHDHEVGS